MGAVTQGEERFDRWWNTAGDWVEAPNVRRGGESGVQRLQLPDGTLAYVKRQVGHLYRSLRHPLGRPTALRERATRARICGAAFVTLGAAAVRLA